MSHTGRAHQREWRCWRYSRCLFQAARDDLPDLPCPCDQFELDPGATTWRDVEGSRHLVAAILFPDVYDHLTTMMSIDDPRKKGVILRLALRALRHQKRGTGRHGPWGDR